ncbi:MAG: TonB-dependent receptor [Acidobacteriota bacterium]
MKSHSNRLWPVMAVLMALAMAAPALAQQFTGRIEITAVDSTGAVLPGVTIELTGPQSKTAASDADGVARFLNLPPGVYQVKASLQGFNDYLNNSVPVVAGGNVQLRALLRVGGVQEQVEVTAETPVIDAKKTGTTTAVTLEELQNIPSARDPWVVMQTVPGIIMDRVNVGGGESGQQSNYMAKGASGADATWNIDGVPVTDMAATGASAFYYDFDMFQEMSVSTGGSELTAATGGVALNMVLKSGTNTPHGSARIYFENEDMQSNNMDPTLATNLGSPNKKGNRISQYSDYGFELGGPIFRDKLWGWGSYGKTDIRLLTIRQAADNTILKNAALKLTGQITDNLRGSFTYFWGDKNKYGRGAGATRPPETTWNQKGPSPVYKGEINWVAGNNLFLTGRYSYVGGAFQLDPQGGLDKQMYLDDTGTWHGSYWDYGTVRPQYLAMAEGNYFRGRHEVKFGYSWRKVSVESYSHTPGNQIWSIHIGYPDMIAQVASYWASGALAHYQSAWVGDTMTFDRATINAGVRFDWQDDGQLSISEPAVPGFEQWLPAVTGPAAPKAIKWNSFSPRLGMTYALDENRKTQLRTSYAMFASQLGNGTSDYANVVQYRYIYFYATDRNGNRYADPNEIDYATGVLGWGGFNINNPGQLDQPIHKIRDYTVPKTHEVIVGVDRELFRNFGVSASFTYRYYNGFNWRPRAGVYSDDYVQSGTFTGGPLPDGSNFSSPYYAVDATRLSQDALNGSREYTARKNYHQRFWGIEASATKRLSNRWMARFGFSTNDHREYFGGPEALGDPTPGPTTPNKDGGLVVRQTGGSGKSGIYMLLPKYQFIANGLYQGPWGIDLGFNMVMRQGYSQPWFRSRVATGDRFGSLKSVLLVTDVDQARLPSVTTFDLRVGKVLKFGRASVNIDLDVFNLFNSGTVLGKQYDYRLTGVTGFDQVLEILSPRVARVGARISF